jgi:hypothetical protein
MASKSKNIKINVKTMSKSRTVKCFLVSTINARRITAINQLSVRMMKMNWE